MYRAKERLHLARDGKTVVRPGDPRSATLLVAEGGEMSDEDARRYGLLGGGAIGQEDVLSLESSPNLPPAAQALRDAVPQTLNFGGNPPPSTPQPPEPPASNPAPAPQGPAGGAASGQPGVQGATSSDLPATFPHRTLLVKNGLGMVADLKKVTRDELINKDQIGAARADEIMAAVGQLP